MNSNSRYAWKVAAVLMVALSPAAWAAAQFGGGDKAGDGAVVELNVWYLKLSASKDNSVKLSDWQKSLSSREEVTELVDQALADGIVQRMHHPTFQTLEQQPVSLHLGKKQPRVVATAQSGNRVTGRHVQGTDTGLIINGTVLVRGKDRLLVNLTVEESYLEPSEINLNEPEGEEPTKATQLITFTLTTSVVCPDGGVVCAFASTEKGPVGEPQHAVVLVSARRLDAKDAGESPEEE